MQTFRICGKQKSSGGSGKHGEHVTSPRRVGYFLISYHSYKHKQVSFSDTCVSLTRQIVVHCWRCWGRGRLRSNTLILPPPQKNASHLQLNLQKQYHPWQAHHDLRCTLSMPPSTKATICTSTHGGWRSSLESCCRWHAGWQPLIWRSMRRQNWNGNNLFLTCNGSLGFFGTICVGRHKHIVVWAIALLFIGDVDFATTLQLGDLNFRSLWLLGSRENFEKWGRLCFRWCSIFTLYNHLVFTFLKHNVCTLCVVNNLMPYKNTSDESWVAFLIW